MCGFFSRLLTLLLMTGSALAQFTTVTGTVTDPNGLPYAGGTISAALVSSGSPTLNGLPYSPPQQPSGLNSAGTFTMRLADVTVLLPGGSTWSFTVCSGVGTVQPSFGKASQCFTVTGVSISGASQDIGATLTAAALALTVSFGAGTGNVSGTGTINFLPVWTAAHTLGNSTISATTAQIQFGQAGTPLTSTIGTLSNVFPNPANCGGSATVPITANPPYGCIGSRILNLVEAGTTSGAAAGLSVEAFPTHFVAGTLGVGVSGIVQAEFNETEERGMYAQAWESSSTPTVGIRRGFFGLAVNNTGNTTATNEAGVFQSGSTSGTNTADYSVHVLVPSSGGALTTHAGIKVEAQATGVEFQTAPHLFSALPTCNATYEGSWAGVTDATSATNGATVVGGGAHHVLAYCNSVNWLVVVGT